MLLFEVLYTKCKICKAKIGKGGRDHRFGVCDKHVSEGMAPRRERQDVLADLTDEVREVLWQDYKDDPFFPAGEETPDQMDDTEYLEFEDHVKDVVNFARAHRIRNPQKAIFAYHQELHNMMPQVVRH